MAAYGLLTARRTRGEYQPMLPRPNSLADAMRGAPGPFDPYAHAQGQQDALGLGIAAGGGLLAQAGPRGKGTYPVKRVRRGLLTDDLVDRFDTPTAPLNQPDANGNYHLVTADMRMPSHPGFRPGLDDRPANFQQMAGGQTANYNQTVAPNGLLREPITGRGHYNNAMVNNGGLLTNAQAADLQTRTGYMPTKTVGGRGPLGAMAPTITRPVNPDLGGGRSNYAYNPNYERPAGSPSSGDYFTDNRQGYGPYGPAFAAALGNKPVDRTPARAPTQDDMDRLFNGRYEIGPRGEMRPTETERSRRQNYAASTEGMANTARLAENREAYQTQRQGLLADRRANVTQIAMNRRSARQDRLAARNAPQQGMGLLEQMAMRDPRNAAQLLAMRQQGLLAQQGLSLQQQQLQQQGMLAGNRMGLDRELGMLNAQNQRDANQATLARFGKQDQQQSMENFANLVGALPTLKQTNPALARQIEMQLPIMAGNSMGLPFSNAPSRQVARQKPPGAVGGILSQDEWDSMGEMTPEQQRAYLRSKVTDPVQRRTVEKQLAGPGVLDYFWEGAGMAGSAISPRVNGLFDDPANPRDPQPGELEISPNDTPQQRAIKMRLRQRLLQRQQYIPR
jgi:hypothetical protein